MKTKTVFNTNLLNGAILCVLLIIPYAVLFLQNDIQRNNFTKEDGIIENLSAIFYFLASIVFLSLFFKSKSEEKIYFLKRNKNYFFILLGLLFFFCFGEEISWGQRIFGIVEPEQWKALNAQGELNIHNLYIIQPGEDKTGIALWFTSNRIFFLFWFFFCLILPISIRLSLKLQILTGKIHFPVVPIWLGVLLLINQVISSAVKLILPLNNRDCSIEIKETNCGLLFLVLGIYFYIRIYGNKRGQVINEKSTGQSIRSPLV